MNYVIIGIFVFLVVIIGLQFLKLEHETRKIKIIIIIVLLILLYLSVVNVFSKGNIDLSTPKGIAEGFYAYVGWVGHAISGLWDVGTETTGKVIQTVKIDNSTMLKS